MNYETFLARIRDELKSYLDKVNCNGTVDIKKVLKNNGIELDALTLANINYRTSPTIYLNGYYEAYKSGRIFDDILGEIIELLHKNIGRVNIDLDDFTDFSKIKNMIAFKVINADKNKRLLKRIPHVKRLDLAIVFYCIIKCNQTENATTLIYNQHLDMWGVSMDEIYEIAMQNTPQILPYEIKSMTDIIKEMMGEEFSGSDLREDSFYNNEEVQILTDKLMEELAEETDPKMYVLTNIFRLNGAASLFYEGVLREFANEHDKDLIILPSSIHEVILIPMEEGMCPEDFKSMIREVNSEEVDPAEVLAEHAYVYRRERDEIYI